MKHMHTQTQAVYSPNGKTRYWIELMDGKPNYLTIESTTGAGNPKFHVREDTGDLLELINLLREAHSEMRQERIYGVRND